MKRVLLCFLFFLSACGPSSQGTPGAFSIGRDPTWFPLRFENMNPNINGFTNALIQEIGEIEKVDVHLFNVAWNQLFQGLEKKELSGILTSIDPTYINLQHYSFSDPFLLLGPVLVVPIDSSAESLADLQEKTVGAYQYDDSVLLIQRYPSILIEMYHSVTTALEDIVQGKMQGALIPNLEAQTLIPSLYANNLKIVTSPLTDKGLRLITLKDQNIPLVQHFNDGLKKLIEKSAYRKIRSTFGVD